MSTVDIFDAAVDGKLAEESAPEAVRALLRVAHEVGRAFASSRLDTGDRERIYTRSLALLGDAVDEHRRGWQRVLRIEHPVPALVGAAALTLGAAVGWAVLHGRRSHTRPLAA